VSFIQLIKSLFSFRPKINYKQLITDGAIIIDVRTKEEYNNAHSNQSLNIPLNDLPQKVKDLDASKTYITCCASGMRSAKAKAILHDNGFVNVHNAGSWQNINFE
jgi:phage shock protein E